MNPRVGRVLSTPITGSLRHPGYQGLFDPVFMKTTKAFERGLEGLEIVAPQIRKKWALDAGSSG